MNIDEYIERKKVILEFLETYKEQLKKINEEHEILYFLVNDDKDVITVLIDKKSLYDSLLKDKKSTIFSNKIGINIEKELYGIKCIYNVVANIPDDDMELLIAIGKMKTGNQYIPLC